MMRVMHLAFMSVSVLNDGSVKDDERARIITRHQIENIFQDQVGALFAAPHQSNMEDLCREVCV